MSDRIISIQQCAIQRYERTLRTEREFERQLLRFLKDGQVSRATAVLEKHLKELGENG